MMVVVERDLWITRDDWQYIVTFVGNNLPSQFANNTASPVGFLAANMYVLFILFPSKYILLISIGVTCTTIAQPLVTMETDSCLLSMTVIPTNKSVLPSTVLPSIHVLVPAKLVDPPPAPLELGLLLLVLSDSLLTNWLLTKS